MANSRTKQSIKRSLCLPRTWLLVLALLVCFLQAGITRADQPDPHVFFVQITDTHWGAPGNLERTRKAVERINALPVLNLMGMHNLKPSLPAIVWNDWPALFCSLAIPGIWLIHGLFPLIKPGSAQPILLPVCVSLIAGAGLWWRIARIVSLFTQGMLTQGLVVSIRFIRDRARLEYAYNVEGTDMVSWSPVHKTKRTLVLHPGQAVEILYHPVQHHRSIVADLYRSAAQDGRIT